jgi:phenylpropionate dioxygenase-like ring-hydroxylating dioxygenase large terminal subunit
MKRILLLLLAILITNGPVMFGAAVRYDAKTWRTVQTYDVVTLSKNLDAHMRELVAVKCNFRGKDIHHMKPNWYESSIWQNIPEERGKFAHVSVMVAKPDVAAFKSIPTDSSGAEITLYGRVEYDASSKFRFLRLVGRNATTDSAGNATVTW